MLITPEKLLEKEYIKVFVRFFDIQEAENITIVIGIAIIVVYFTKNIGLTISAYLQTSEWSLCLFLPLPLCKEAPI